MPNNTARKLKALRDTLGLSASDMAREVGISPEAYRYYEYGGNGSHNTTTRRKIDDFISKHAPEDDTQLNEAQRFAAKRKAMVHHFKEGQHYCIYTSSKISGFGGISWEKDCTFIYLRKEGKHHFFRELNGGWLRTYTDAQLIGKKIVEVNS